MKRLYSSLAVIAVIVAPATAHAGCGGAFCSLNTLWEAQGIWSDPGARVDLRFEYLDQDQPRAGREDISVGEIHGDHDEVRTINRNLIATFDFNVNSRFGISVNAPWISRSHSHIHDPVGAPERESWDIDGLGDVRVLGRYAFATADGMPSGLGVTAGLKLPTGDFEETNDDGDPAERMLQPGTGTTDVIAGIYYHTVLPFGTQPVRGFAQLQTQYALDERDDYRPGWQYSVDLGLARALAERWNAMVQINTQIKGRERGAEAEPDVSGGTFAWLSPGTSYEIATNTKLYAYVQLPIYQRTNGVQLVPDVTFVAGVNARF